MIGTHPVAALAPLEYRYAFDVAVSILGTASVPLVLCNVPQLMDEVCQRLPDGGGTHTTNTALWVEPLVETWHADLTTLAGALPVGGLLVIVVSRLLACLLPERRSWGGRPLGFQPGSVVRLPRALIQAGFTLEASYGLHSAFAIGLSLLSHRLERWGRPDLGDRLHFAARLCYCITGPLAVLSTVALLVVRKTRG